MGSSRKCMIFDFNETGGHVEEVNEINICTNHLERRNRVIKLTFQYLHDLHELHVFARSSVKYLLIFMIKNELL